MSEYFESKPPAYSVLVDDAREFQEKAKIRATPTLVLVEPGGRVARVWRGAWGAQHAEQLEQHFGCELPGLRPLAGE